MIEIYVGERIRELRKLECLTQEQLALKSELDRTYIASVEAGKRNISIVNLDKIAFALNCDLYTFFQKYRRVN